ncbi:hypothetical protein PF008_g25265 [Phytophthora fragariae]|uniref:Uncharacterized protein n=1 Tax=Phytophthora fragariae TaxID=53985 RepID=A0A6G0QL37_9STRA|nr:hypothetical protein PF008_g25265 [Phytophthora fragariae]
MRSAVVAKTIAGSGKKKNVPRKKHADEPDDEDDDSDYVGDGDEGYDEEGEAVETQEGDGEVSSKAATSKTSVDTSGPTKKLVAVAKKPAAGEKLTAATKKLVGGKKPKAGKKSTVEKRSPAASSKVPQKPRRGQRKIPARKAHVPLPKRRKKQLL